MGTHPVTSLEIEVRSAVPQTAFLVFSGSWQVRCFCSWHTPTLPWLYCWCPQGRTAGVTIWELAEPQQSLQSTKPFLQNRCRSAGADRATVLLLEATSLQPSLWLHLNQAASIYPLSLQMVCKHLAAGSLVETLSLPLSPSLVPCSLSNSPCRVLTWWGQPHQQEAPLEVGHDTRYNAIPESQARLASHRGLLVTDHGYAYAAAPAHVGHQVLWPHQQTPEMSFWPPSHINHCLSPRSKNERTGSFCNRLTAITSHSLTFSFFICCNWQLSKRLAI